MVSWKYFHCTFVRYEGSSSIQLYKISYVESTHGPVEITDIRFINKGHCAVQDSGQGRFPPRRFLPLDQPPGDDLT